MIRFDYTCKCGRVVWVRIAGRFGNMRIIALPVTCISCQVEELREVTNFLEAVDAT